MPEEIEETLTVEEPKTPQPNYEFSINIQGFVDEVNATEAQERIQNFIATMKYWTKTNVDVTGINTSIRHTRKEYF